MSLEALAYVRILDVADPLATLVLWVIAENTPNATGVCPLSLEQIASAAKTTRRKAGDRLKKLGDGQAPLVRIDADTGTIELVGLRAFLAKLSTDAAEARANPEPAPLAIRGRHDLLLEELRRAGCSSAVIKHYLTKVSSLITIGQKEPRALFLEVCTKLAEYPDHVLKLAADRTVDTRSKLTTIKQVMDDVKAVIPQAQIKITPAHAGWPAWLAHFRTVGKATYADFLERQGMLFALTEYPPGHWAQQASEGKAA